MISHNGGTDGRVYGGNPDLVHIADGKRRAAGRSVARQIDATMRTMARRNGRRYVGPLCPGCYMICLFNASVALAEQNGQPLKELAATMANAYAKLAETGEMTEEITCIVDPD